MNCILWLFAPAGTYFNWRINYFCYNRLQHVTLESSVALLIIYLYKLFAVVHWAICYAVMWYYLQWCWIFVIGCFQFPFLSDDCALLSLFLNCLFVISCETYFKQNYIYRTFPFHCNLTFIINIYFTSTSLSVQYKLVSVKMNFVFLVHKKYNNYQPYLEFPLNLVNLVQVYACRHKLTKYYIVTYCKWCIIFDSFILVSGITFCALWTIRSMVMKRIGWRVWSIEHLFNLLKPTGYGMHQQLEYFNCTLCPHCIYVFCVCLRTNSDLCLLH
jgi:hypothetical protein